MKKIATFLCQSLLILAAAPGALLAHPGHGNPAHEQTMWHYLLEARHGLPVVGAIALAIVVTKLIRSHRSSR